MAVRKTGFEPSELGQETGTGNPAPKRHTVAPKVYIHQLKTPFINFIENNINSYPYLIINIDRYKSDIYGSNEYIDNCSTIMSNSSKIYSNKNYNYLSFKPISKLYIDFKNTPITKFPNLKISILTPNGKLLDTGRDGIKIKAYSVTNLIPETDQFSTNNFKKGSILNYPENKNYIIRLQTVDFFSDDEYKIGDIINIKRFFPSLYPGGDNNFKYYSVLEWLSFDKNNNIEYNKIKENIVHEIDSFYNIVKKNIIKFKNFIEKDSGHKILYTDYTSSESDECIFSDNNNSDFLSASFKNTIYISCPINEQEIYENNILNCDEWFKELINLKILNSSYLSIKDIWPTDLNFFLNKKYWNNIILKNDNINSFEYNLFNYPDIESHNPYLYISNDNQKIIYNNFNQSTIPKIFKLNWLDIDILNLLEYSGPISPQLFYILFWIVNSSNKDNNSNSFSKINLRNFLNDNISQKKNNYISNYFINAGYRNLFNKLTWLQLNSQKIIKYVLDSVISNDLYGSILNVNKQITLSLKIIEDVGDENLLNTKIS